MANQDVSTPNQVFQRSTDHFQTAPRTPSRPQSYYDNFMQHISNGTGKRPRPKSDGNTYSVKSAKIVESPTQTHCLATTVPQNIAAQNIGGKHTPTRNSLRHSRMIVLNRNGRIPRKYLPAIIRYHKLAKALMGLVTLCGVAICFLAVWFLVWARNLRPRDNPYWSGIPVFISGVLGLVLLCCCRKQYPGGKPNYIVDTVKVLSIFTSILGATTALIAASFAIIHLVNINTMNCGPLDNMNKTCVCSSFRALNDTRPVNSYHYKDLTCAEVDSILTVLLMFASATNILAGFLEIWYIYLHWASRVGYTYMTVRTEDPSSQAKTENS